MTNEEMYIALVGRMDDKFGEIDARFEKLENRFDSLENRFDNLENEVKGVKLLIENDVMKRLDIIEENYVAASKRYIEETAKNEELRDRVDVLERVVTSHSEQLKMIS